MIEKIVKDTITASEKEEKPSDDYFKPSDLSAVPNPTIDIEDNSQIISDISQEAPTDISQSLINPIDSVEDKTEEISNNQNYTVEEATEKIRNYFFNTFYKEHLSLYKVGVSGKRPIYWMLNSGSQKSFKALVYMHRWNYTTVDNIRKNLLTKQIKYYKDKITELEENISVENKDEYSVMMKLRDDLLSRYEESQEFDKKLEKLSGNTFDLNDGIIKNHQSVQTTPEGEVLKVLEKI